MGKKPIWDDLPELRRLQYRLIERVRKDEEREFWLRNLCLVTGHLSEVGRSIDALAAECRELSGA